MRIEEFELKNIRLTILILNILRPMRIEGFKFINTKINYFNIKYLTFYKN